MIIRILVATILVYEGLLLIRVLSSWVISEPRYDFLKFLYQITDPYLNIFRKALPFAVMGNIDFTPIIGFLLLDMVRKILQDAM